MYYIDHQLKNPLCQLFSLRVEEIPGYQAPFKGFPELPAKRQVARERIANDLLFGMSLKEIDKKKRNEALTRMGFTVTESKSTPNQVPEPPQPQPVANTVHYPNQPKPRTVTITTPPSNGPKKQMVLDSWIADKILIDSLKQKKQKETKEKSNGTKRK